VSGTPPAWEVGEVRHGIERRPVPQVQVGDVLVVGGEVTHHEPRADGQAYYLRTVRMGGQTLASDAAVLVVVEPGKYATLLRDV
jgi:hypothetical protein